MRQIRTLSVFVISGVAGLLTALLLLAAAGLILFAIVTELGIGFIAFLVLIFFALVGAAVFYEHYRGAF